MVMHHDYDGHDSLMILVRDMAEAISPYAALESDCPDSPTYTWHEYSVEFDPTPTRGVFLGTVTDEDHLAYPVNGHAGDSWFVFASTTASFAVTINSPVQDSVHRPGVSMNINVSTNAQAFSIYANVVRNVGSHMFWQQTLNHVSELIGSTTPSQTGRHTAHAGARNFIDTDPRSVRVNATANFDVMAVPSAPGQPSASTPTTNSVTISWGSVSGATEYVLERDGTRIWSGTGLSRTVTGLSPGTTYSFRVRASNAAGESGLSTARVITTQSPPLRLPPLLRRPLHPRRRHPRFLRPSSSTRTTTR